MNARCQWQTDQATMQTKRICDDIKDGLKGELFSSTRGRQLATRSFTRRSTRGGGNERHHRIINHDNSMSLEDLVSMHGTQY